MVELTRLRSVAAACLSLGWARWSLQSHMPTPHLEAYHDLYINNAHTGNESLCIAPGSDWAKLRDGEHDEIGDYLIPGDIPQLKFKVLTKSANVSRDQQTQPIKQQGSTVEALFTPMELTGGSRLRYNALDAVFAYHLDCVLGLGKVLPAVGAEVRSRAQLKENLHLPMIQKFAEYGFSFDEYHQQIFGTIQQIGRAPERDKRYFKESWLSRMTRSFYRRLCDWGGGSHFCLDSDVQRALNEMEAFHFILGSVDSSFTVAETTDRKTSEKARMLLPSTEHRMLSTYYSSEDPFLLRVTNTGCQHSIRLYERLIQADENHGSSKDRTRTLTYRLGMLMLEDPLLRKYWYRMVQSPKVMRRMGLRRRKYVAHIASCAERFGKEYVFFR